MQQLNARFGFGCYRISDADTHHEEALRYALEVGIDVVDTSYNYTNGGSERLVGKVLKSLPTDSKRPLVITKIAYADNDTLNANAIQSLMRLGANSVDVLLLHNPEEYLQTEHQAGTSIADAREAFYARLEQVFRWMEVQRTEGRIASYGVSSNTFIHEVDAPDHVSLQHCLQLAQMAGGERHGFEYIQLPFNIIEHFACTTLNQFDGADAPTLSTLDVAKQNNITVIANRPLNAIVGAEIIRLVSHETPPLSTDAGVLEASIHELEIVEHDVMQLVHATAQLGERETAALQETFRIGAALCQSWNKFEGIIHWRDVRRDYLEPRLLHAATYISRLRSEDAMQLELYTLNMRRVFDDIDALYCAEENDSLEELRTTMAEEFELPPDTPLQQIALHAVRCTEGINIVLVGMRTPEYVDDVYTSYSLPETTYHRATWQKVAQHLARLSS